MKLSTMQTAGTMPPRCGTILVVDDDEVFRLGVELVLQAAGYEVVHAANSKQALDYVENGGPAPDLILLDMLMPRYTGWDFLARRQADAALASIPFFILTAMGAGSPEWARSVGASGFIRKPVEIESLLEVVSSYRDKACVALDESNS
jgi:CheY-like chemotaxis protein